MNENERPSVSVRQRAAAINRSIVGEEKHGSYKKRSKLPVKPPWQSAGSNAKTVLPQRPPVPTFGPQIPQRKLTDPVRRDTWRSAISSTMVPRRPDPTLRKRELAEPSDNLPLSKFRKLMMRPERHRVDEAITQHERSPSIGSMNSSATLDPILHDDKLASYYAEYYRWRLTTIESDESSDRKQMEEENRLWAIYDTLWELRAKHGNDEPAINQIGDRLKQLSIVYEQLEEILEGTGSMKSADGLVQNLQSILNEIHTYARDLGGFASDAETEFGTLEKCRQIINSVAQVEAENQSLSAIL